MISWVIVGALLKEAAYIYIPVSLFLLKSRDQYLEMLLGFFFLLILSDSRNPNLAFAAVTKEIYVVMLGILLFSDRRNLVDFNGFFYRFIPFFVIAFICIFNGPGENYLNAFEKTLSYTLLLIVVPNYFQRAYTDKGKEVYRALILLSAAILSIGFILRFISPHLVSREGRFEGLLGNPNGLGVFALLFFLFFTITLDLYTDLFTKREKTFIYIVVLLSLVLSGSRGSLFGVIIYMFFSFFYRRSFFLGAVITVLVVASYSYISANLVDAIHFLGLEQYFRINTLEEGSGRFVAWKFTWDHIQESFWFGRGFEYTTYLFSIPENVTYLQSLGHIGNIHNSYLTLWLDTGLVGLSAYCIAFLSCFIKASKKTKLAMPLMFAIIFSTFFESWLTASLNPFTIQVIIILSILTSDVIFPAKAKAGISLQ
jgi:O-antigen ligase